MPVIDHLGGCCCRGAGANADNADALDALGDSDMPTYDPTVIQTHGEGFFPVGSVATLVTQFEANRGLYVSPRLVSEFEKMPNGNWVSQPGQDVYYPTLFALNLAAPVMRIDTPDLPPNPDYQPVPAWEPPPFDLAEPRADVMPWEFGAPDPATPPFYDGSIGGTTPADALAADVVPGPAPSPSPGTRAGQVFALAAGAGFLWLLLAGRRRRK